MITDSILKFLKLEGLMNNITGYFEARIDLMKYEIKEDLARGLTKVSLLLLSALLFIFFLIFISFAVAFKLGEILGSFNGFSIVAGFYLLILAIIVLLRKAISKRVEKKLKDLIIQK